MKPFDLSPVYFGMSIVGALTQFKSICSYVCLCFACMCVYEQCVCNACGGQKKEGDPSGLELQIVVNHRVSAGNGTLVL